jgi:hypothetical protein
VRRLTLGTLIMLLALGVIAVASAGWIERQVGEWHEMSYCAATPPKDELTGRASSFGHRWAWRLGWPPGRWTCVYRGPQGRLLGTRAVP